MPFPPLVVEDDGLLVQVVEDIVPPRDIVLADKETACDRQAAASLHIREKAIEGLVEVGEGVGRDSERMA